MSIMDILDPFTMKNVIIYEKGWKVCFRETSVVVFECKDVLFEPFVCHRQKWEERKLGEYEGERGEKPKQSKAKERAIRRSWCFWACFWRRRRRGFHFHYFDSLFFICVFVSWFVEIQFILFLKRKMKRKTKGKERKGGKRITWEKRKAACTLFDSSQEKQTKEELQFHHKQKMKKPNNPSLHHDHPLNLSILLSGGKENNHDGESNSEWKHQEWVQHENLTFSKREWEL